MRGTQVLPIILDGSPVLRVQAGPGTGKTFGLRKRVLRLLHAQGLNCPASRVLVCAFNRVIADDLRAEIGKELEEHGLELPRVQTIHSLSRELSGEFPRFLLPHEIEIMLYDVRIRRPKLDQELGGTQKAVMRALREHEAGLANRPSLMAAVGRWLEAHGADLVGNLPRRVEDRLRRGEFGDWTFDHVMVDEFQDLTEVEARLAIGLCSESGTLVVLGDRKQSIYAFRGNENRGLGAVPSYVSRPVRDHCMDECQRCPSEVVDLANQVAAEYREPLQAVRGSGGQLHVLHFTTPHQEQKGLAREVVRAWKADPGAKHLVLVTRRKWGYDLRSEIYGLDSGIRAETAFAEDVLETLPAREAFVFLSILGNPDDAVAVRDWIGYRTPDGEGKKWKAPKRNALAYLSLVRDGGVLDLQRALVLADMDASTFKGTGKSNVIGRLRRLKQAVADVPPSLPVSGIVEHVMNPERWAVDSCPMPDLATEDIARLRREANRIIADEDLTLGELVQRLRYSIATREPLGEDVEPDIKIVTLWGAKGLTADYVYIVGLCDEALPGAHDPDSSGLDAAEHRLEQLRLLYVSLTRATKSLVVSRPSKIQRGEVAALRLARRLEGSPFWQELAPCRFLNNVHPGCLPDSVDGSGWRGQRLPPNG